MSRSTLLGLSGGLLGVVACAVFAFGLGEPVKESGERKVTEADVPGPALTALKKLANKAAITEFAEEVEHSHKFYEGSWTGPDGKVDALVTESGDLVETEEVISADKVPAVVRAQAEKEAGKDAKVTFEKKTMVMYEVHFKKGEKGHEVLVTPDGRSQKEGGKKGKKEKKDDDD